MSLEGKQEKQMLKPKKVYTKKAILDFSSSGLGKKETSELYLDDFRLSNAIDLVEYNSDATQFTVCPECGTTDCSSGDYLSLRRIDKNVAFIPAFEKMRDDSNAQYSPHKEISKLGGILLDKYQYLEVQKFITVLPLFEYLPTLKNSGVPTLLQWESSVNALDKFPYSVDFRTDLYLATSSDLGESIITKLEELINLFKNSNDEAQLTEVENGNVSIFLDIDGYYEWNPMWEKDGDWGL